MRKWDKGTVRSYQIKAGTRWEFLVDLPRGKNEPRKRETKRGFLTKADAARVMAQVLAGAELEDALVASQALGATLTLPPSSLMTLTARVRWESTFVASEVPADPQAQTFAWLCDLWWQRHALLRCNPKTCETYAGFIRVHMKPHLGPMLLRNIREDHLQRYLNHLCTHGRKDGRGGLSYDSVKNQLQLLRTMFGRAMKWKFIDTNVAEDVGVPRVYKIEKDRNILTPAQAKTLLGITKGTILEIPIMLAVATGMRRGEILGLRWSATNLPATEEELQEGVYYVASVVRSVSYTKETGTFIKGPKTGRTRKFPLPMFVARALVKHREAQAEYIRTLQEHPELQVKRKRRQGLDYDGDAVWVDHDLVCPRGDGYPHIPNSFSHYYRDLTGRSNLPKHRLHDLRHCFGTFMVLWGVDWKTISQMMGHSSVQMTMDLYAHVLPEMQERAVRAMDEGLGPTS